MCANVVGGEDMPNIRAAAADVDADGSAAQLGHINAGIQPRFPGALQEFPDLRVQLLRRAMPGGDRLLLMGKHLAQTVEACR